MNGMKTVPVILGIALFSLAGCQKSESDSGMVQRARLIGAENLRLKQQLEEKDEQIARLQEQLEQNQAEKEEAVRQAGEANIKILQLMAETDKKNQELATENQELRQELERLKSP